MDQVRFSVVNWYQTGVERIQPFSRVLVTKDSTVGNGGDSAAKTEWAQDLVISLVNTSDYHQSAQSQAASSLCSVIPGLSAGPWFSGSEKRGQTIFRESRHFR